jgi:hypothetical protein
MQQRVAVGRCTDVPGDVRASGRVRRSSIASVIPYSAVKRDEFAADVKYYLVPVVRELN